MRDIEKNNLTTTNQTVKIDTQQREDSMTKQLNLSFSIEVSEDTDESQVLDALLEVIPSISEHLDHTDINLDLAEETAIVSDQRGWVSTRETRQWGQVGKSGA